MKDERWAEIARLAGEIRALRADVRALAALVVKEPGPSSHPAEKPKPKETAPMPSPPKIERRVLTLQEVKEMLRGASDVTIWRLEKLGYLKRLPGIRSRLYLEGSVREYLNGSDKAKKP